MTKFNPDTPGGPEFDADAFDPKAHRTALLARGAVTVETWSDIALFNHALGVAMGNMAVTYTTATIDSTIIARAVIVGECSVDEFRSILDTVIVFGGERYSITSLGTYTEFDQSGFEFTFRKQSNIVSLNHGS